MTGGSDIIRSLFDIAQVWMFVCNSRDRRWRRCKVHNYDTVRLSPFVVFQLYDGAIAPTPCNLDCVVIGHRQVLLFLRRNSEFIDRVNEFPLGALQRLHGCF
jgi:hypothetical protein